MFTRQARKHASRTKPFSGFKGSPERIGLLEMMRPKLPIALLSRIQRQVPSVTMSNDLQIVHEDHS